jgi:hypothetical protein
MRFVAVVLEDLPLRLVRVREDDALERNGRDRLGADVVALLGRREQRVQPRRINERHRQMVAPVRPGRPLVADESPRPVAAEQLITKGQQLDAFAEAIRR